MIRERQVHRYQTYADIAGGSGRRGEPCEDEVRRSVIEGRVQEISLMERFAEEELGRLSVEEDTVVQVQLDGPGAVNPTEEKDMEQQVEDKVVQEEVMEVEDPQGEVVESADMGQHPLDEVEKSPANQQGQSPVLGLTSPRDKILHIS